MKLTTLIVLFLLIWLFVCYWQIAKKAGYSGWWGLTVFIPFVWLIIAWVFPFMDWPVLSRRRVSSQGAVPTAKYHSPMGQPSTPVAPSSGMISAATSLHTETNKTLEASVTTPPQNVTDDNDAIYAAIAEELETGAIDKSLWTRLYAELDGDESRTKAAYIRSRADLLMHTLKPNIDSAPFSSVPIKSADTTTSFASPILILLGILLGAIFIAAGLLTGRDTARPIDTEAKALSPEEQVLREIRNTATSLIANSSTRPNAIAFADSLPSESNSIVRIQVRGTDVTVTPVSPTLSQHSVVFWLDARGTDVDWRCRTDSALIQPVCAALGHSPALQ